MSSYRLLWKRTDYVLGWEARENLATSVRSFQIPNFYAAFVYRARVGTLDANGRLNRNSWVETAYVP